MSMGMVRYDSYVIHKVPESATIYRKFLISTMATKLKSMTEDRKHRSIDATEISLRHKVRVTQRQGPCVSTWCISVIAVSTFVSIEG